MSSPSFEIISKITNAQTIAAGRGVRRRRQLERRYGMGAWLKRKGVAKIRFDDGTIATAEVHWYEATGIGRKDFKIKRMLD